MTTQTPHTKHDQKLSTVDSLLSLCQTLADPEKSLSIQQLPVQYDLTLETIKKHLSTLEAAGFQLHFSGRGHETTVQLVQTAATSEVDELALRALQQLMPQLQFELNASDAARLQALFSLLRVYYPNLGALSETKDTDNKHLQNKRIVQLKRACSKGHILRLIFSDAHDIERLQRQHQEAHIDNPLEITADRFEFLDPTHHAILLATTVQHRDKIALPLALLCDPARVQIEETPRLGTTHAIESSITFQLIGRLVRNYQLYNNERILNKDTQAIVITHKTDRPELLYRRLLRYGASCRVLSPEFAVSRMKTLVDGLEVLDEC